jgi:hypothetical protein
MQMHIYIYSNKHIYMYLRKGQSRNNGRRDHFNPVQYIIFEHSRYNY